MKKILSILLVAALMFTLAIPAFATDAATKTEYLVKYTEYTTLYNDTYVVAYNEYNAQLDDLLARVAAADIKTAEDYARINEFVNYLINTKAEFFGTRETVGKSRYEVPFLRNAMMDAASTKDYDLAILYCEQLMLAVQARIDFLANLADEIAAFEIITEEPATESNIVVRMVVDEVWSTSSSGFKIYIENNSDTDITDWQLTFDVSGASINTMWGGVLPKIKSGNITVTPTNKWSPIYTIPANTTIMFSGSINGDAYAITVSNGTFNGSATNVSYTIS